MPTTRQNISLVSLAFWRGAMRASGLIPLLSTIWPKPVCRCRPVWRSSGWAPGLIYSGQTLLIDPYLTRVPLKALPRREPALADPALHSRYLRDSWDVVGILVGHTHFDHAIDVPELARSYDTMAYGSDSLMRLMGLYGLGDRAVEIQFHHPYELGPFTVRFIPSLHSKLLLGYKVPMDGALTCDHLGHLSPRAYRCGAVTACTSKSPERRCITRAARTSSTIRFPPAASTSSSPGSRDAASLRTTGHGSCGAWTPRSSSPTTTTISSDRYQLRWGSRPTSTWPPSQTRSVRSAVTSASPRCR